MDKLKARSPEERTKAAAYQRQRTAAARAQGLSSRTGEPLKHWRGLYLKPV